MGFSEQLKKARLNMNYTQQQVADLMGITKSTYCGYETGKRQPDVAKIKLLANILNTSGDILLETGFKQMTTPENKIVSELHQKILSQLEKMNAEQMKAVFAFINSLDELENSLTKKYGKNCRENANAKKDNPYDNAPTTPEELERLYPPVNIDTENTG